MIKPILNKDNNIINKKIEMNNNKDIDIYKQCYDFNEFMKYIRDMLNILNIGLSKDQILFQKLLIIMNNNISEVKKNYLDIFKDLFTKIFFPSLSLIDPCPSLLSLLWDFLSNFDYITRYTLYENWLVISYKLHPYL